LGTSTLLKLLYSFCSSFYGAELWDLYNCNFDCIGVAWRKALKRIWSLPWRTHSNLLYALCNKWRIEDEIYRRSLLFGLRCVSSDSSVVRFVSRFGIKYGLMNSVLGRNVLFGCEKYGLKVCDFLFMGQSSFCGSSFQKLYDSTNKDNVESWAINLLHECVLLRNRQLSCSGLDNSQLTAIISHLCCS